MKSKIKNISCTLLASLACLTAGSISPVNASCEKAPSAGSQFKLTGPDSFKFRFTERTQTIVENPRKLDFLLTQTDRKAQAGITEFFTGVVNGNIGVDNESKLEFIVADEDMSEKDKLEGFEQAIFKINTEITNFNLVGSRKVGSCIEPGKQVAVTREISSDSIFAARSFENESTKKDDDVAIDETVVSDEKGYKSQVSGGYDGYADMEEF